MKSAAFAYRAPSTLPDALADLADGTVPLAGGQSLMPLLNRRLQRPATVLDLNRIGGLDRITVTPEVVRIGAMTRLNAIERSTEAGAVLPVLTEVISYVAHYQIRLRATFGGSLCHADPAAELPALAIALDARLRLNSSTGERLVPAADFFTGPFRTCRRPDELLTEVELPVRPGFRFRFAEVSRRGEAGLPLVSLCLGVRIEDGRVAEARAAASGAAPRPARLSGAEQLLVGRRLGDPVTEAAAAAAEATDPSSDLHGSREYRRNLVRVLLRRSFASLTEQEIR
jgi:carbon-monoxide dehydrogenase medium subunit